MDRKQIEQIFYGQPDQQRRFTQDFPVLPDVWIAYGTAPDQRFELLLTPHSRSDAATAAQALRERLKAEQAVDLGEISWKAAHAGDQRARILFNESVVLAKFSFWELMRVAMPLTDWWRRAVAPLGNDWIGEGVRAFIETGGDRKPGGPKGPGGDLRLLKKLIAIAGAIECEREGASDPNAPVDQSAAFTRLFGQLTNPAENRGLIWGISLNRPASTSVWRSRMAVKADAAARLFDVNTDGIRWAVLDTGIDARHPAFQPKKAKNASQDDVAVPDRPGEFPSRVVATYDFLRIKQLLDPDSSGSIEQFRGRHRPAETEEPDRGTRESSETWPRGGLATARTILAHPPRSGLRAARALAWHSRGRHHCRQVAGAKDTGLEQEIHGICPDLEIYDMRVLGPGADEFTVIAALQFVRHLNAHKDLLAVHGVNLSMSVPHDVANYACGRTPVCEECDRVVANGVVVVTAAGNRGFNKLAQPEDGAAGDYRYISITDPGNADSVITVGSTHRYMPHSYGVSYFSSRGPTGDGRTKPDLVAPGERIDSCAPDGDYETMDGTSMAAPHVSGAAALLIGRHRELIGQPKRVKEIIVKSATDLGREPRFQGAGMLDVLRALQSV